MNKNIIMTAVVPLLIVCFSGCSVETLAQGQEYAPEESERFARIEVYAVEDSTLINTIEDMEILSQFSQWSGMEVSDPLEQSDKLKQELIGSEPLYSMIAYKSPAGTYNDGALEKTLTITVYENTNIIELQFAPESVKGFPVPDEYLVFYYDISDEDMDFLISLAEGGVPVGNNASGPDQHESIHAEEQS